MSNLRRWSEDSALIPADMTILQCEMKRKLDSLPGGRQGLTGLTGLTGFSGMRV